MKTIIAGSREKYWPKDLDYMATVNDAVASSRFVITKVVSGMAGGFDLWGIEWAKGVGLPWEEFPANWYPKGRQHPMDKAAGYKRNEQMGAYSEAAIVIWDGSSRGSKHMIDIARQLKMPTYVHIPGFATDISGAIGVGQPGANMYGCQPCPRCKQPYRCVFTSSPHHISCNDCNFMEPITKDNF